MLLTWNIHVLIGSAFNNKIYKWVYSLDLAWTQILNPISLFQIDFLLQLDDIIFIGLFCLRDKLCKSRFLPWKDGNLKSCT